MVAGLWAGTWGYTDMEFGLRSRIRGEYKRWRRHSVTRLDDLVQEKFRSKAFLAPSVQLFADCGVAVFILLLLMTGWSLVVEGISCLSNSVASIMSLSKVEFTILTRVY